MSRLTPAERATLFRIEAHLIAQDPHLAVRMRRLWGMSAVASSAARQARQVAQPQSRFRAENRPCPARPPTRRTHAKLITAILIAALMVAGAISVAALVLTGSQQSQAATRPGSMRPATTRPVHTGWEGQTPRFLSERVNL